MKISLKNNLGESFEIESNDLIIAIDETGHEEFKDSNFPLFGLSACLFLGKDYYNEISKPWNNIKKMANLSENDILHASEVDINNKNLINGIGDFFKNGSFGRIAIGCSKNTKFLINIKPVDLCVKVLFDNIRKACNIYQPNNIFILIESSNRLNKTYKRDFMSNNLIVNRKEIKTIIGTIDKSSAFPPIEIADFICHAHGNHILREIKNERTKSIRKDMNSVFVKTKAIYSYNKNINEVG